MPSSVELIAIGPLVMDPLLLNYQLNLNWSRCFGVLIDPSPSANQSQVFLRWCAATKWLGKKGQVSVIRIGHFLNPPCLHVFNLHLGKTVFSCSTSFNDICFVVEIVFPVLDSKVEVFKFRSLPYLATEDCAVATVVLVALLISAQPPQQPPALRQSPLWRQPALQPHPSLQPRSRRQRREQLLQQHWPPQRWPRQRSPRHRWPPPHWPQPQWLQWPSPSGSWIQFWDIIL